MSSGQQRLMYSRHILYKEEINYHSFSNLLEFIDFLNFRCLILFLGVSLVYLSCITVMPPRLLLFLPFCSIKGEKKDPYKTLICIMMFCYWARIQQNCKSSWCWLFTANIYIYIYITSYIRIQTYLNFQFSWCYFY